MTTILENPIQFKLKKIIENVDITYSNLNEIVQGGPEIGNLSVNGKAIEGLYGGPTIYQDGYIYTPAFTSKFLTTGFKLARINAISLKIEYLGKIKDLIFLEKVEGNRVYFFEDLNKTVQRYYDF